MGGGGGGGGGGCLLYDCTNVCLHSCPTPILSAQQFGKEILADEKSEIKYDKVLKILEAASGANYGTGK